MTSKVRTKKRTTLLKSAPAAWKFSPKWAGSILSASNNEHLIWSKWTSALFIFFTISDSLKPHHIKRPALCSTSRHNEARMAVEVRKPFELELFHPQRTRVLYHNHSDVLLMVLEQNKSYPTSAVFAFLMKLSYTGNCISLHFLTSTVSSCLVFTMDDTRLSWLLFTVLFCIQLHCIPAQSKSIWKWHRVQYLLYLPYAADKKPPKESWITGDRTRLLEWLIGQPDAKHKYAEQNGLDGFANNPFQPELGAFGIPYISQLIYSTNSFGRWS